MTIVDEYGLSTFYFTPVVEYEIDNKTYKKAFNENQTQNMFLYSTGSTLPIYYNKKNPEDVMIKEKDGENTGFLKVGLVILFIGIALNLIDVFLF